MKAYGIRAYSTIIFNDKTIYKSEILAGGDNEGTKKVFAEMKAEIGELKKLSFSLHRTDKVELLDFKTWDNLQNSFKDKTLNYELIATDKGVKHD